MVTVSQGGHGFCAKEHRVEEGPVFEEGKEDDRDGVDGGKKTESASEGACLEGVADVFVDPSDDIGCLETGREDALCGCECAGEDNETAKPVTDEEEAGEAGRDDEVSVSDGGDGDEAKGKAVQERPALDERKGQRATQPDRQQRKEVEEEDPDGAGKRVPPGKHRREQGGAHRSQHGGGRGGEQRSPDRRVRHPKRVPHRQQRRSNVGNNKDLPQGGRHNNISKPRRRHRRICKIQACDVRPRLDQ